MNRTSLVLQVEELRKSYRGRTVLSDVSFEARAGEAIAIIGSNGAGKSTMLGCITGERLPDGGRIRVCGADPLSDPGPSARCTGFVPEHPFLYGELTVGEMLRFVTEARDLPRDHAEAEIQRLLRLLSLEGTDAVLCRELSQGMGRKVAIIAALLHEPQLLVLDEVFNGLDQVSTRQLLTELDTRRRAGAGVLLASHDLALLARWCDRGLLLAPGAVWRLLDGDDWDRWTGAPHLLDPAAGLQR